MIREDDMLTPRESWALGLALTGACAFWVGIGLGIGYLLWG